MRIAICEDFPGDAERLKTILSRYLETNLLAADVDCFKSGEEFLNVFEPGKYQIIFMDIYMKEGGITGLQTAEKVQESDTEAAVILTTNSNEFGIPGYKVAVYYIVKPIDENEFGIAMQKCRAQIDQFAKTIEVMENRQPIQIRLRDIYYVESKNHVCIFQTAAGEIKVSMSIGAVTEKLGGSPFLCCHRSFIVNLVHITDMLTKDFVMKNGVKVPISKAYLPASTKAFKEYLRAKSQESPV